MSALPRRAAGKPTLLDFALGPLQADFRSFADAPLIAPIDNLWRPVPIAV
jgi:hypothetical protein